MKSIKLTVYLERFFDKINELMLISAYKSDTDDTQASMPDNFFYSENSLELKNQFAKSFERSIVEYTKMNGIDRVEVDVEVGHSLIPNLFLFCEKLNEKLNELLSHFVICKNFNNIAKEYTGNLELYAAEVKKSYDYIKSFEKENDTLLINDDDKPFGVHSFDKMCCDFLIEDKEHYNNDLKINYSVLNLKQLALNIISECENATIENIKSKEDAIYLINELEIEKIKDKLSLFSHISIESEKLNTFYIPINYMSVAYFMNKFELRLIFNLMYSDFLSSLGFGDDCNLKVGTHLKLCLTLAKAEDSKIINLEKINTTTTINDINITLISPLKDDVNAIEKEVEKQKDNILKVIDMKKSIDDIICKKVS